MTRETPEVRSSAVGTDLPRLPAVPAQPAPDPVLPIFRGEYRARYAENFADDLRAGDAAGDCPGSLRLHFAGRRGR